MNQGIRAWLLKGAKGVVVIVVAMTILARLGHFYWAFDLFALLHHYYFAAGGLLFLVFITSQHWRWVGIAAVVIILNGWLLLPYVPAVQTAEDDSAETIRVLVYNMYYANDELARMVEDIEAYEADVVFIMEYSYDTQAAIEAEFDAYEHRLIEPSRMTMGLALFSHLPITSAEVHRQQRTRIPVFEVGFEHEGRPFTFVGGHPWPPLPQWGSLHRAQMGDVTAVAAEAAHPLIVAGDFNASVWSYAVRNLVQTADVRDAHEGFLFQPTWTLNPLVHLPMDHVFVSEAWQVVNYQHGDPGGSDHDFLVLDLVLP